MHTINWNKVTALPSKVAVLIYIPTNSIKKCLLTHIHQHLMPIIDTFIRWWLSARLRSECFMCMEAFNTQDNPGGRNSHSYPFRGPGKLRIFSWAHIGTWSSQDLDPSSLTSEPVSFPTLTFYLITANLMGLTWCLLGALIYLSLTGSWGRHLFLCLLAICIFYYLFISFALFFFLWGGLLICSSRNDSVCFLWWTIIIYTLIKMISTAKCQLSLDPSIAGKGRIYEIQTFL